MEIETFLDPALVEKVMKRYKLDPHGIHGPWHWARVLDNGLRIAALNGADIKIIAHFALLHDCCRRRDNFDPGHGGRAALFSNSLDMDLTYLQRVTLCRALSGHTFHLHSRDLTIATCWDADRLDISRTMRDIESFLLTTKEAKDPDTMKWAQERGELCVIPDWYNWDKSRPETDKSP